MMCAETGGEETKPWGPFRHAASMALDAAVFPLPAEIRSLPALFSCVGALRVHNRPRLASVVLGGRSPPVPAPRTHP